jgi:hypothetical protein
MNADARPNRDVETWPNTTCRHGAPMTSGEFWKDWVFAQALLREAAGIIEPAAVLERH